MTDDGTKLVVELQSGDKESATNWREFFKDYDMEEILSIFCREWKILFETIGNKKSPR